MDELDELDEEFRDDPDYQRLSREEKLRILRVMERMMELGMAAVYGDEPEGVPDSDWPCERYLDRCKAKCCTFIFALTKEEVAGGRIAWNRERPYFVARDADGYCPHLDREAFRCTVYEHRPLRCRRYDCREDEALAFLYENG
ncbi:MAG TPA: YkgJ family cysteine cluster protein [Thiotrichales bacterium]|nr:YkgJ family cysteine cluster protein [Thiotrichales bacterium]